MYADRNASWTNRQFRCLSCYLAKFLSMRGFLALVLQVCHHSSSNEGLPLSGSLDMKIFAVPCHPRRKIVWPFCVIFIDKSIMRTSCQGSWHGKSIPTEYCVSLESFQFRYLLLKYWAKSLDWLHSGFSVMPCPYAVWGVNLLLFISFSDWNRFVTAYIHDSCLFTTSCSRQM